MKLTEIAVTEREKQLRRQMTAQMNPLIKNIIETELKELREEWTAIKVHNHNSQVKK